MIMHLPTKVKNKREILIPELPILHKTYQNVNIIHICQYTHKSHGYKLLLTLGPLMP